MGVGIPASVGFGRWGGGEGSAVPCPVGAGRLRRRGVRRGSYIAGVVGDDVSLLWRRQSLDLVSREALVGVARHLVEGQGGMSCLDPSALGKPRHEPFFKVGVAPEQGSNAQRSASLCHHADGIFVVLVDADKC